METLPLRDIHLPDPIGWWPLAPGWWGVLGLVLLIISGIFWWRRKKHRRNSTPWQAALTELDRLATDEVAGTLLHLVLRSAGSIPASCSGAGFVFSCVCMLPQTTKPALFIKKAGHPDVFSTSLLTASTTPLPVLGRWLCVIRFPGFCLFGGKH